MNQTTYNPFKQILFLLRQLEIGSSKRALLLAAAVVVIIVTSSILTSTAPLALKALVDQITQEQTNFVSKTPILFAIAYASALAGGRMLSEVQSWIFGQLDQNIQTHVRLALIKHILELRMETQLDLGVGKSVQAINNALRGITMLLNTSLLGLAPIIVQFVTITLILSLYCNVVLVFIFVVSAIIYAYVFAKGATKVSKLQKEAAASSSILNGSLTDFLSHGETIKYLSAEPAVVARINALAEGVESNAQKFHSIKAFNGLTISLIFFMTIGATVGLSFFEVADKLLTIGEFVLINSYVLQIIRPLEVIGIAYREMNQALAMTAEIQEIYKYQTENLRLFDASLRPTQGRVVFHDVNFVYPTRKSTLTGVSFELEPGSHLAIVGSSGSGKSTLARLLAGIYSNYEGEISLDGISLTKLPVRELRSTVLVVSQDIALFDSSVAFNTGAGTAATAAEIHNALTSVGLGPLINELPLGIDTIIGQRGLKLSAGQRQRIGFARAALRHPKMLILDEVTSSLDAKSEREILNIVAQLFFKTTIISIAHRLRSIMNADQILVFDDGRIIESGTHIDLLKADGFYARMWDLQHDEAKKHDDPVSIDPHSELVKSAAG